MHESPLSSLWRQDLLSSPNLSRLFWLSLTVQQKSSQNATKVSKKCFLSTSQDYKLVKWLKQLATKLNYQWTSFKRAERLQTT